MVNAHNQEYVQPRLRKQRFLPIPVVGRFKSGQECLGFRQLMHLLGVFQTLIVLLHGQTDKTRLAIACPITYPSRTSTDVP